MPFLLFFGVRYYPNGAWRDFVAAFGTQAEAEAEGRAKVSQKSRYDEPWWQVVDVRTLVIVSEFFGDFDG